MDHGNHWFGLADHIVINIFSYVSQNDRFNFSLVCKDWSDIFNDSELWKHFTFKFDTNYDKEGRAIECAKKYSNALKDIDIYVNQSQPVSLERSLEVLDKLVLVKCWKLVRFKFAFTGRNPLCFNGRSILNKVKDLLQSINHKECVFNLEVIDLSKFTIVLDNNLLNILADNHKHLRVVHIQNECLTDNITEKGIINLLKSCIHIEEFYAFYQYIDDEAIEVLADENRATLKILSLFCNRSMKFTSLVTSDAWKLLKKSSPNIELEIKFDSMVPRNMVIPIICDGTPATSIDLHLYSWMHEQIQHIAQTCKATLKSLSCHTNLDPNSVANEELPPVLRDLVTICDNIEELHCHCVLPEDTIKCIKAVRDLKASTLYSSPRDHD